MERRRRKGFTLMEMLIVVAVIAILVAIAIPTITSSLESAREATCAANRRSLKGVLSAVYMTEGEGAVEPYYEAHREEYTCPAGGRITYKLDKNTGVLSIFCNIHARSTTPEQTMLEIFEDMSKNFKDKEKYPDFPATYLNNDKLREYYYQKNGNCWPEFNADGVTYYVQPYIDATSIESHPATKDVYLFANQNGTMTKKDWNAKYFYFDGNWYVSKTGKGISVAYKGWDDLKEQVELMETPPAVT